MKKQLGGRVLGKEADPLDHSNWEVEDLDAAYLKEAEARIAEQELNKITDPVRRESLLVDPGRHWESFYSKYAASFFKDRQWLPILYQELFHSNQVRKALARQCDEGSKVDDESHGGVALTCDWHRLGRCKFNPNGQLVPLTAEEKSLPRMRNFLEMGCGAGNTLFPLVHYNSQEPDSNDPLPPFHVYGCDVSTSAINLIRKDERFDPERATVFVYDLTNPDDEELYKHIPLQSLDAILLIFVLSALDPALHVTVLSRLSRLLKPDRGIILIREYCRLDLTQLRFKKDRCLEEHRYVRGDGTQVYFHDRDSLLLAFEQAGMVPAEDFGGLCVDKRLVVNRKTGLRLHRLFLHGRFKIR